MSNRISVKKTCKLFIGGKFPRTESGRYDPWPAKGPVRANICRASRKDARNAVVAARAALGKWSAASPYLRGQILYRIAEILDSRFASLVDELRVAGHTDKKAVAEVRQAVDLWVYYAGWTDKFQAVSSAVNPVATSHFVFSVPESMGVLAVFSEPNQGLAALSARLAPLVAGGNTVVAVPSAEFPTLAVALAEALQVADLPGGVINLLTGRRDELLAPLCGHQDVNGLLLVAPDAVTRKKVDELSADAIRRVIVKASGQDWESPQAILDFQEVKTTWHPVEPA